MRGLVSVLIALVLFSGCGGGDPPPGASPALAPSQSASVTRTTAADPDDAVELVYLTDSTGFEVAEVYTSLAEEELGVPVELIDLRLDGVQMVDVLELVDGLSAELAAAEIIVLWAGPGGSGVKEGHERCVETELYSDPGVYTVDDWAPFADVTGEVLDAIWAARAGRPAVVRVTDIYVPVVADWEEHGIRDACMTAMATMSDAVRAAAEAHGATLVSALDLYNGPDHTQDPVSSGLISSDGMHPSEAGGRAMAEALAATGFDPTPAP